ncbi:MAG: putative acyltransferase [Brevundimonas sp.]|jgi:predicted acyltransferase|uniref:acyltransferase family protein n=1 Tax=Brevundimonas sp. TaxID=1871086 RepID=UPI0039E6845A
MVGAQRLASLDVMRGFAVVGMIIVNWAATVANHHVSVVPWPLLHAEWTGLTPADLVFPAFVVLMGVSLGLNYDASVKQPFRRVLVRSSRLFAVGLVLSNLYWLRDPDPDTFRILGVLQRLALVYLATALLIRHTSSRFQIVMIATLLVGYWAALLAPLPSGVPRDITVPGANFVSWFDRVTLSGHIYVPGPSGYDPEGVLSTFPAVALCMIGVMAGLWLCKRTPSAGISFRLAISGALFLAVGVVWSGALPIVKNLWTSSYAMVSAGLTLLILASAYWLVDVLGRRPIGTEFFRSFGLNAIAAYVLHALILTALSAGRLYVGRAFDGLVGGATLASLFSLAVVLGVTWFIVAWLRQRQVFLRI